MTSKPPNENKPSLVSLADPNVFESNQNNSIFDYLSDIGFDPKEIKNWGKIGSLTDALKLYDENECTGSTLDDSFVKFIQDIPVGSTPRPTIRHSIQREPIL